MSAAGKALEATIGRSIDGLGFAHNSNHLPLCDWSLWLRGRGPILIECKECSRDKFDLARISVNERKCLNGVVGHGFVAVIIVQDPTTKQAWCGSWSQWTKQEDAQGFVAAPIYDLKTGKRPIRKRGSAHFPLSDEKRPEFLLPLKRTTENPLRYDILGAIQALEDRCLL